MLFGLDLPLSLEDEKNKVAIPRKEGELSELHKKLLDPARFDYDPDFARAGSLQFMHPLQCSKGKLFTK